jgi:hypothetical protein
MVGFWSPIWMIEATVIISLRGDAQTLLWTLEGFAQQRLPADVALEVRVGGDGCPPPAFTMPAESSDARIRFSLLSLPRSGAAVARNLLLEGVNSDVLIFANHDTRPDRDFVSTHVRRLLSLPPGSMVLGSSPYESAADKTVFDVLKEDSPMIFFYDRLKAGHFYDYRYAWTLNLSIRRSDFQRAGGFSSALRPYGYEDLDLGFRVMGEKAAIYYDPAAAVLHRHPMSLDDYLNREETIGSVAPNLNQVNPRVFASMFGTNDLEALAREYRIWTSMDAAAHRWTYHRLSDWANQPQAKLGIEGSEDRNRLLLTLYQMHIPLKRLAFRLGFLRGLELMDDSRWLERGSKGLWREAIK